MDEEQNIGPEPRITTISGGYEGRSAKDKKSPIAQHAIHQKMLEGLRQAKQYITDD